MHMDASTHTVLITLFMYKHNPIIYIHAAYHTLTFQLTVH